jgi:hypothetical protein
MLSLTGHMPLTQGKKLLAQAHMPGSKTPGVDLKDVEADTPKTFTLDLMDDGKKGLKKVAPHCLRIFLTACLGGTGGSQRGECGIGSAYLPCLRLTMGVDVRSGW